MNRRFYIIAYDLRTPGRDYTDLYMAIKSNRDWQHPLESTWIVWTTEDANDIYKTLKPTLDQNDLLFISDVNLRNRQGWLAKSCWEWMNERINHV